MTEHTPSIKRPWSLILLSGFLALYQLTIVWHLLTLEFPLKLTFPSALQLLIALVWAVLWFTGTVSLYRLGVRGIRYSGMLFAGFILTSFVQVAIWAGADYDRLRLPFLATVTVILIGIIIVVLIRPHAPMSDHKREVIQHGSGHSSE